MATSASIPKGTRDFLPQVMLKRQYIFNIIQAIFQKHGYLPIETPAMEHLSTLMGKYGTEGDRLLFRIMNNGLPSMIENTKLSNLSEKGLRYDLTVPFARFVVQHKNEISFPFKRYQVQPVWRGDQPQKGRYREFYQCDIDVIGSESLLNEIELLSIISMIFEKLNIDIEIKLNNRKILLGIAQVIGQESKLIDITIAIDKIDKIGLEKVVEEMISKDIPQKSIDKLVTVLEFKGSSTEKLNFLNTFLSQSEIGKNGIRELQYIFNFLANIHSSVLNQLELDISLARGLNYYTGAIIEVKAKDVEIGSICGGGRYDDLTGIFGMPDTSGVGISFGADRIFDVMEQLNIFPDNLNAAVQVMFVSFGGKAQEQSFMLQQQLVAKNIPAIIYPDAVKLKKQFSFANKQNIPYVAVIGEDEAKNKTVALKNMVSGTQETMMQEALINKF